MGFFDQFNRPPSSWGGWSMPNNPGGGTTYVGENEDKRPVYQTNPYTAGWMKGVQGEQNYLGGLLFGGPGGGGGYLNSFMNPTAPDYFGKGTETGNFMNQFMGFAPQLQGLTRQASDAELAKADYLSGIAANKASSDLSGLGSLYSSMTGAEVGKARQASYNDLASKIASENFGLLGNLYGQGMQGLYGLENTKLGGLAELQGIGMNNNAALQQAGMAGLFGLYGQNAGALAGASAPMFQGGQSQWDKTMQAGQMFNNTLNAVGNFLPWNMFSFGGSGSPAPPIVAQQGYWGPGGYRP